MSGGVLELERWRGQQVTETLSGGISPELKAVFENLSVGVFVVDCPSNTVLFMNQRVLDIWRFSELPKTETERLAKLRGYWPDGRALVTEEWASYQASRLGRVVRDQEIQIVRGDGSTGYMVQSATPLRDTRGEIYLAVVTLQDVTDEVLARKALQLSEARFRATFDQAAVGMAISDRSGHWLQFNEVYPALFGYTATELRSKKLSDLTHPDDLKGHSEILQILVSGKAQNVRREKRYIHKNGSTVWADVQLSSIRDEKGEPKYILAAVLDITERRRAELGRATLASIVQHSDDAIVSKNLEGVVTSWNLGAEKIFGFTREEMIGKSILTIIPPDRVSEETMILERVRWGSPLSHFETERLTKAGNLIPVSITVSPIKDSGGAVIGISKIARDISAQKKIEADLREAIRTRDTFVSAASHELRTPLAGMKMQLDLIQRFLHRDEPFALSRSKVQTLISQANRSLDRLVHLVEDMLDISQLSMRRIHLRREPVDLSMLVHEVLERFTPQFEKARMKVEEKYAQDVRGNWDPYRLEQVITNLITNAIRYASAKPLRIRVESKQGVARLMVEDEGPGIPTGDQERIFGRFERVGADNATQGLGLGLYIAREIAQLHGGEISVESDGKTGTRFILTLPTDNT